ncbi:MAG: hypothetical protein AAF944_22605 [Bacteroidota bacterium]
MRKTLLTVSIISLAYLDSWAQKEVVNPVKPEDPVRIGLKFGLPNIAGLNVEYVTPWLNGRLAPTADFIIIPINYEDEGSTASAGGSFEMRFSYLELGLNYYFTKPGRGFYGNISYGRLDFFTDISGWEDPSQNPEERLEKLDMTFNNLNLKIGARWGGTFYFRPEIGLAFMSAPNGVSYTVIHPDGTIETVNNDSSGYFGVMPLINLGFGIAF